MTRHFLATTPDGVLHITHLKKDDPTGLKMDRINFHQSRPYLNLADIPHAVKLRVAKLFPDTTLAERRELWRVNIFFKEYSGPVLVTRRECVYTDLPKDRYEKDTFRDAWEDTGTGVQVNMPKALVIKIARDIRPVRDEELKKESGSQYRQPPAIEALFTPEKRARLQVLRDIPQTFAETFGFTIATTPEELTAMWPDIRPRRE